MSTILEQIAARVSGGVEITQANRADAIDAIIDTIGCMIAGRGDMAVQAVRRTRGGTTDGPSDLVGGGRARAAEAALLNGVAAHALDFDDNFAPGMSHASAVLVPALIALGQAHSARGRDLVDAYLVGLEAQALVGQGVRPQHYTIGWHGTSTVAPIGSAAGAAALMGLSPDGLVQAMSLATSTASGPKGQFGTPAKPFHAGVAARNAVEAALLAAGGLWGRTDILERPQGFGDLFGAGEPAVWEIPGSDVPHALATEGVMPKLHPCCGSTHNSVDMVTDLRHAHGFGPGDVRHITLTVGLANYRNLAYPDPANEMEARFSMQYCVARALSQDVLSLADFTPKAVADPKIRALLPLISMEVLPEAEERAALRPAHRARVELTDGRVFEAKRSHARGTIADPLDESQRRAKFIDCCGGDGRADAIWSRLKGLETERDLGAVSAALRSFGTSMAPQPA